MTALDAIFRYKQPERGSVVPTFFIGLGGAGGSMVDRIMQKVRTRWDQDKFRGLYHALVIDTDTSALDGYVHVPRANRVLISDFSKRDYVAGKRGESYVPEDPHLLQWTHDWYHFRSEVGAGAGQIRLESRLCLHYQLERDRGGIVHRLQSIIRDAMAHDNPFRRASPAQMNVFFFASVAGGTGSGSLLPMAYLVKRLVADRNHQARSYACVMLPGPFFHEIPHCQREDIDANGYAALKEIEHLMRLGISGPGGLDQVEFRYSGFHRDETHVREAPFNFVYLLDEPEGIATGSFQEFRDAVSDAMFVQFFSPVAGVKSSGWDNMVKRVQGGSADGYVLNYGTYGAAVLIVPDRDILEYCARRFALDALDRFLLQRRAGDAAADRAEARHAVDVEGEDWALMTPEAQGQALDTGFVAFVDHMAADEPKGDALGLFQTVQAQRSATTGAALRDLFDELVAELLQECYAVIRLNRLQAAGVSPANKDVAGHVERLRQQVDESSAALTATLRQRLGRVHDGAALRELFDHHRIGPLAQRYFLIHLVRHLIDREAALRAELAEERGQLDLDSEAVRASMTSWQAGLDRTAPRTLWERIRGENRDFNEERARYVDWFNRTLRDAWNGNLRRRAEREVLSAFTRRVQSLLQVFRDLSGRATALRGNVVQELQHILRVGGLDARSSDSNLFALDIEALRDEASGLRLWDRYYDHVFARDWSLLQPDLILPVVNRAFDPVPEPGGRMREPSIDEIAQNVVTSLVDLGRRRLAPSITGTEQLTHEREAMGLLLDDALALEAQLVRGRHLDEPVGEASVRQYVDQKLVHAARKAGVLCSVRPPADDPSVEPDSFLLACAHPVYAADGGLTAQIERAASARRNDRWDDPKVILLYRAHLGMPLFWVEKLNGRMKAAYLKVQRERVRTRTYPLHIDKHWEHDLPDLDPEARRAQEAARAVEDEHVRWLFCRLDGSIVEDEGGFRFTLGDLDRPLGRTFADAFPGFKALPELVRSRLDAGMREIREQLECPYGVPEAWAEIGRYLQRLSDRCMGLPVGDRQHEHLRALSAYVRAHTPEDALGALRPYLAPEPAA